MFDRLGKNILATVVYYDGLDYPLTAFEVWKYLIRTDYCNVSGDEIEVTLKEIIKKLEDKELFVFIEQLNGFYFLKGRRMLVEKRIANGKISSSKLKRIRSIAKTFRFIPFVRMVGVTGGVAMKNATQKSDLDFLIVFKNGKIWTGRTLVTIVSHILGKRRHKNKVKDRVCLNFFVTDQTLEVITKDLFSANEYMFIYPIFGWDTFVRFQIKNHWIKNMKPHYALAEIAPLKILDDSKWSKKIRTYGEAALNFDWLENILRKIEKKRILKNPKTNQEGSLIYANDDALVFLPNPHGPKVFEKFKERLDSLSV